ncbi:MAG: SBBP repeat-containing protein [Bacteroidota bacterium]
MKALFLVMTVLLLFPGKSTVNAQHIEWARRIGGTGEEGCRSLAIDKQGNVYIAGTFQGTNVDFDPGPGTALISSSNRSVDIVFAKYDPSGNYLWVKRIGGSNEDIPAKIVVDGSGNVFVAGWYQSATCDFDPGPGTVNLGSVGYADMFFAKYDTNGNLCWANRAGSTNYDGVHDIFLDPTGNLLITGYFNGTVNFDPGPGTALLTDAGGGDLFFAKYDASGNYLWAKRAGGTQYEVGNSIITDPAGNIYVSGPFMSTNADFDPGAGTAILGTAGGYDMYLAKYDPSGNYQWAKRTGGILDEIGGQLLPDPSGNLLVAGMYKSANIDFDPGNGIVIISSSGGYDFSLAKYSPQGNLLWAKGFGGTQDDYYNGIITDDQGNVHLSGQYMNSIDLDPGAGSVRLSSAGMNDAFFAKYDSNGNYVSHFSISCTADETAGPLGFDLSGNLASVVAFNGSGVDMDPGPRTTLLSSAGGMDMALVKFSLPPSKPYLGQTAPGKTPVRFAPGILTQSGIFGISFSPDGGFCFFSGDHQGRTTVHLTRENNGVWTTPAVAPFSGTYLDAEPHITPAGNRLYFGSMRPVPGNSQPGFYQWQVDKTATGWSEARPMDPPLQNIQMMYPSVAANGNLYFTDIGGHTTDPQNPGIVVSGFAEGQYSEPVSVGDFINSKNWPGHPFISPDENYLIFDAVVRTAGENSWRDLFISFCDDDGLWTRPVNLGNKVNTVAGNELSPFVSRDGKYFFFSRDGNVYWVDAGFIETLRTLEPDSSERIVFSSSRDGNSEIYSMLEDGSEAVRLTDNTFPDGEPCLSPDGSKIVFTSERDQNTEIYLMNADGSGQIRLTNNPADDIDPVFSPNGQMIAFIRYSQGQSSIMKINDDGTNEISITQYASEIKGLDWSPDGLQIVFASSHLGNYDIHVVTTDGSNADQLTFTAENEQYPRWSLGGTQLLYYSFFTGNEEKSTIQLINADGSGYQALTDGSARDELPCWSPDDKSIAFASDRDGETELFRMNADGSHQRQITNNEAEDSQPNWGEKVSASGIADLTDFHSGLILYPVAPNPVTDQARFDFSTNKTGRVELVLIDENGTITRSVETQTLSPGKHTINMDLSGPKPAMYIARLSLGTESSSQKIIKQVP